MRRNCSARKGKHDFARKLGTKPPHQNLVHRQARFYVRNPRKNDAAVNRMCSSIHEFGFKIPVLARSDGEVVDGHLRLKAARKLGITEVPVILCDEWTPQQVKAFRPLVNRSVTWAEWDEDLLSLELHELNASDFDLSLTGFDPGEIDGVLDQLGCIAAEHPMFSTNPQVADSRYRVLGKGRRGIGPLLVRNGGELVYDRFWDRERHWPPPN